MVLTAAGAAGALSVSVAAETQRTRSLRRCDCGACQCPVVAGNEQEGVYMRTRQSLIYSVLSGEYFESFDRYIPDAGDFISVAGETLSEDWTTSRSSVWYHCVPNGTLIPAQGWKIHISSIREHAIAALRATLSILVPEKIAFKFAADLRCLALLNSKQWNRGGSGKFITVYPANEEQFRRVIDLLHAATEDLVGAYILSDRRYRDSRCIFYRYGSMLFQRDVDVLGRPRSTIEAPNGDVTDDVRSARFTVPSWTRDPFEGEAPGDDGEAGTLSDGRYKIKNVLSFTNGGGVYLAQDRQRGVDVVIKEGRPNVCWVGPGLDALALLRKEYRILQKIADSGIAPSPVDYFIDWEHEFLVEEFLEGGTLAMLPAKESVLLRASLAASEFQRFYDGFRKTMIQVCRIVEVAHKRGIVFADLSPHNLMINDRGEVRAIDFEAACEEGIDEPTDLATEGFYRSSDGGPSVERDHFAIAAIMLHYIFNYTSFIQLSPGSARRIVSEVCMCARIPQPVCDVMVKAFEAEGDGRPTAVEIRKILEEHDAVAQVCIAEVVLPSEEAEAVSASSIEAMLADSLRFIEESATPDRADRLFPACFRLFESNPLSLLYGATGTVAAVKRAGRTIPAEWLDWLLARNVSAEGYPAGLFIGMAGIAWALLDLGLVDAGRSVLEKSNVHPLVAGASDLGYGLAGRGMANLRFFTKLGDEEFLQNAKNDAREVLGRSEVDEDGRRYWTQDDGVYLGLGRGSSGVALFLLYLGLICGDHTYIDRGREALDFDLAHRTDTPDGGWTWGYRTDFKEVLVPYWGFGSAGVGSALVRYCTLAEQHDLHDALDRIFIDTRRKFAVLPGKQNGLSGIGGFNLDAYSLTGETRWRESAMRAFEGICLQAIKRSTGVAFTGDFQGKISCDYASGSAGVVVFLHRLQTGSRAEFLLDNAVVKVGATS